MSQNSQDAIDVLSKVIVDTIEKKLNDAKFDKSQTGVVTAVSGNTYTISVFGSQYNITSDQIYTVGQSVVVTALQGDMKRLVCSPDNIGTMKTVDSKVNVVGSQLSIIDTDFADTIVKYTDVSEFLTLKDQADGQLSLWFYSGVPSTDTAPTVNWVTEDAKRVHIGDLYYDMKADDAYRWTDTFIWETLSDAIKKAKEPDTKQNLKLTEHDKHLEDIDRKLKNDKEVLDLYRSKLLSLEEHQKEQDIVVEDHGRKIAGVEQRVNKSEHGINVMMKALLALLSHGIDGNAIDPMKEAKAALESYLIDGQNLKDI